MIPTQSVVITFSNGKKAVFHGPAAVFPGEDEGMMVQSVAFTVPSVQQAVSESPAPKKILLEETQVATPDDSKEKKVEVVSDSASATSVVDAVIVKAEPVAPDSPVAPSASPSPAT